MTTTLCVVQFSPGKINRRKFHPAETGVASQKFVRCLMVNLRNQQKTNPVGSNILIRGRMMKRSPQKQIRVQIAGVEHVGQYEVGPFERGGHTIAVFYRGRKETDLIPPEVNHESYTDSLAETLLKRLVVREELNTGADGIDEGGSGGR